MLPDGGLTGPGWGGGAARCLDWVPVSGQSPGSVPDLQQLSARSSASGSGLGLRWPTPPWSPGRALRSSGAPTQAPGPRHESQTAP